MNDVKTISDEGENENLLKSVLLVIPEKPSKTFCLMMLDRPHQEGPAWILPASTQTSKAKNRTERREERLIKRTE